MLLENALSEAEAPPSPQASDPRLAPRDYTAEKDKTIAACTGAVLTSLTMTPFDVIKTRLQTQPSREPLFVPSSRLPPPTVSTTPWPPPVPSTSSAPPTTPAHAAKSAATCCQKTYFSANTSDKTLLCKFDPRIARSALPAAGAHHAATFPQHLHHLASMPAPTQFAISSSAGSAAILATPAAPASCLYPSALHASQSLPYVSHSPPPRHLSGFWDALSHIVRSEGATSLWRGTGPALMMSVPGQVIYMVGYDWGRRTAFANPPRWATVTATARAPGGGGEERRERLSPTYLALVPLVAGSLSRTVVAALLSPVELLRTQLQAQHSHSRTSLVALVRTLRWSTAWKGLPPTLWRDVPFSGIYWAGYEGIKRALTGGKGLGEGTGTLRGGSSPEDAKWTKGKEFGIAFVSGAGSGMIAATLTNPFDVVKTRRQAVTSTTSADQTRTLSILVDIYRREGWNGMTKGLTPRLAKVAPACGIVVGVFEFLPPVLQDFRHEKNLSRVD